MDPRYFMHTLTMYEAELFVAGFRRREQAEWELARYQAFYAAVPHLKGFSFASMGKFPWEKDDNYVPPVSAEQQLQELNELRKFAQNIDKKILNKVRNGNRGYDSEASAQDRRLRREDPAE